MTSTTYFCEKCNYTATKKYNWELHLSSAKHNRPSVSTYTCNICNNSYDDLISFYAHSENCVDKLRQQHATKIAELETENLRRNEINIMKKEAQNTVDVRHYESQIETYKMKTDFYRDQIDELKSRIISLEDQNKKLTETNTELVTKKKVQRSKN